MKSVDDMALPTLEPLERATVNFTGTHVTVLFRDRDRTSTQFKQMVSFQLGRPVKFVFQSKEGTRTEWWTNGVAYNALGPAIVDDSKVGYEEHHHLEDGSLGCPYGPAHIKDTFGVSYVEKWTPGNSVYHRDDGGPASIEIDYGEPHQCTWAEFAGQMDWDGNTSANANAVGTVIKRREQTWYHKGKCTREGSWSKQLDTTCFERFEVRPPMNIMRTVRVARRELRWYDENEKLHRTDGPAVLKMNMVREVEKDGTMALIQCQSWSGEWYLRGNEIPSLDLTRWIRENHILVWNEPCFDKSVFRTDDGELCFITDFAKEHTT